MINRVNKTGPDGVYFKMSIMDLGEIRREYRFKALDENDINPNPYEQFDTWINEAIDAKVNEPTAMVLATANASGEPSARIVLLKSFSDAGFGFFTNYLSRKAQEITGNVNVALLFHWPELERQVRVEGVAVKTSASVSDDYFNSRPFESRLSAVISNQSEVIPDREYLEKRWKEQHIESKGKDIERPVFWGGYIVEPLRIEFWQGRPSRLHDRILYTSQDGGWTISRLAP